MKKDYQKPQMQAVKINIRHQILAGSDGPNATSVDGNVFKSSISGGSENARSRNSNDWDDEE